MKDVTEACKILGIPVGTSTEDVEAAYRELMLVWDPERFPDAPEIQEKARQKRLLIQQAVDCLRENPCQETPSNSAGQGGPSGSRQPGSKPKAEVSASLYEDIFSEKNRPKRKLPLYAVVLPAALVLLIVAALFIPWGGGSVPSPVEPQAQAVQEQAGSGSPVPEATVPDDGGELATAGEPSEPLVSEGADPGESASATAEPPVVPAPAPTPQARPPAKPSTKPASGEVAGQQQAQKPTAGSESRQQDVRPELSDPAEEQLAGEAEQRRQEMAGKAFEILKQTSLAAAKLVIGEVEDMAFREWKPVQVDDQKVLLDLVAFRISDSQELHCIWQIEPESGKVTALSQAARDLEARLRAR